MQGEHNRLFDPRFFSALPHLSETIGEGSLLCAQLRDYLEEIAQHSATLCDASQNSQQTQPTTAFSPSQAAKTAPTSSHTAAKTVFEIHEASQCALRLLGRLAESLARKEAHSLFLQRLHAWNDAQSSLEPEEVFLFFLKELHAALGCNASHAFFFDPEEGLTYSVGYESDTELMLLSADISQEEELFLLRAGSLCSGGMVFQKPDGFQEIEDAKASQKTSCLYALPILQQNRCMALFLLYFPNASAYDNSRLEWGLSVAHEAADVLNGAERFHAFKRLALVDELTGLYNRRQFFAKAREQCHKPLPYERPFYAMMLDLDHFKKINDTHGHPVGDEVLREASKRFRRAIRDSDILGRYGGEEFVLLLIGVTAQQAQIVAERLRKSIAISPFQTQSGPLAVTCSIGVAEAISPPESVTLDLQALLKEADIALYQAKQQGRDRFVFTPSNPSLSKEL